MPAFTDTAHQMPALELDDLACRRGGRLVLAGLSATVDAGEALLVTGRNGSGKTSLLRLLALFTPPARGTIRWQGKDVRADREAWHRTIGWLGHSDAIKPELSVAEMLRFAAAIRGTGGIDAAAAIERLGLAALLDRPGRHLSAGQRRRVALARLAVCGARVWLMDEPDAALDAASVAALNELLRGHLAGGGLAVVATHDDGGWPDARRLSLDALSSAASATTGDASIGDAPW